MTNTPFLRISSSPRGARERTCVFPLVLLALVLFAAACGAAQRPDGGKGPLPVGSAVPDLTRADQNGASIALRSPEPTLVYFYPKDGTPGCTREACAFRDAWERYAQAGVRVIGVSADGPDKHREFAREHGLPFSLVSDPDHVWSKAFGVGTFAGMDSRVSFLIDARGHVAKTYDDVDPGVHAAQVLDDAKRLGLAH